jgi:hypothetical protein
MATAILGLIAAITAALISRSVMISNHRQAWINGLREDLAAFFTGLDVIHFQLAMVAENSDVSRLEEHDTAKRNLLLAFRKILMRLNMNESLHRELEAALRSLLEVRAEGANEATISAAVTLARTVLKREWEVTKYGPLTPFVLQFKSWLRLNSQEK